MRASWCSPRTTGMVLIISERPSETSHLGAHQAAGAGLLAVADHYCYYLDSQALFRGTAQPDERGRCCAILSRQMMRGGQRINFAWQGGASPTLMGLRFYGDRRSLSEPLQPPRSARRATGLADQRCSHIDEHMGPLLPPEKQFFWSAYPSMAPSRCMTAIAVSAAGEGSWGVVFKSRICLLSAGSRSTP